MVDERLFAQCPAGCEAVWRAFVQIGRSRPAGFGVSAISLQEIESWQRLYGVQMTPWELDLLLDIDATFVQHATQKAKVKG